MQKALFRFCSLDHDPARGKNGGICAYLSRAKSLGLRLG